MESWILNGAVDSMRHLVSIILALFVVVGSLPAQLGMGSSEPEASGDPLATIVARGRPRFTVIDNTFTGLGDPKALRDYFEEKGWEARYREDTYVEDGVISDGFYELLQSTDVLFLITHGGVRESTQEVGFVWRTVMGLNKNVLTSGDIAARMEGRPHPVLVVVAGCKSAHNDSMARAMQSALIGFDQNVGGPTASLYCSTLLKKIADGMSYREAYRTTELKRFALDFGNAQPILVEPPAPGAE